MSKEDAKQSSVERLKEQRDKLTARIRRKENREKKSNKKADTKRKILLGAYLQRRMERDPTEKKRVMKELDGFLERKSDREAFGFEVKPAKDG